MVGGITQCKYGAKIRATLLLAFVTTMVIALGLSVGLAKNALAEPSDAVTKLELVDCTSEQVPDPLPINPKIGEHPATFGHLTTTFQTNPSDSLDSQLTWTKDDQSTALEPSADVFEVDHKYTVSTFYSSSVEYAAASDLVALINGSPAKNAGCRPHTGGPNFNTDVFVSGEWTLRRISFDKNEGTGTMPPVEYCEGDEITIANKFTRDGYTFVG